MIDMYLKRFSIAIFILCTVSLTYGESDRIRVNAKNPRYWQYKGRPVVLIGGSVEDNLFQIPDLKEHLDLLKSVGGNYVRNTMSARDEGNVWQFEKLPAGKYDLDQWNAEYWNRFERFLKLTYERDIIVQIEVWATFDYYRDQWAQNPFNPKNNISYTAEETGLPTVVKTHPTRTENNFFRSIPKERNQKTVLKYQRRFVDKMLSYSLKYPNVLYCMDNETSVTPEWGWYWSKYIKAKAKEKGVYVETTEMWDNWNLAGDQHNATFDHPEIFSFVDISQNNHQKGQAHWDNAQRQRKRIAKKVRPLNNVKIYGADTGRYGSTRDGLDRFWRNIFGGLASARFHRPDAGAGLSEIAQAHIKSMRMLLKAFDIFNAMPDPDSKQIADRSDNEAYLMFAANKQWALFFPNGGRIKLAVPHGNYSVIWLDIEKSKWMKEQKVAVDTDRSTIELQTPDKGHWAVVVNLQR